MKRPLSIADRITACLRTLILDETFFGSLALRLNIIPDPAIGTFATNGTDLLYAPDFAASLSDPENTFVLAHEVLHCALGHLWRKGDRDHQQWNQACDYVVNDNLVQHIENGCTVMAMPKTALYDIKYRGMSAEEIYNLLPPPDPNSPPPQPQPCGEFTDPPPEPDPDADDDGKPSDGDGEPTYSPPATMSEAEWKVATIQAQTSEKVTGQGHTTSDLDRLINEHIHPTIPWQDHLREFTSTITRDDYTWTRPNTRYAHTGFILPTLHSESIGDIVIAIDTSGSVNEKLLARFLSESQSLLDSAKPSSITILSCDTSVKNPKTFYAGDTLTDYLPKGGGGTEFDPVFDYIEQHDINPIALIYFTDGYGSFPPTEPHYPTLWLHYGGQVDYPFGQVLTIPPSQQAA